MVTELAVRGESIYWVAFDSRVTLKTSGGVDFHISGPFSVKSPTGVIAELFMGHGAMSCAPAISLLWKQISTACILDDGRLEIAFADGAEIAVPASLDLEAWEIQGEETFSAVVSMIGGEVAYWDR